MANAIDEDEAPDGFIAVEGNPVMCGECEHRTDDGAYCGTVPCMAEYREDGCHVWFKRKSTIAPEGNFDKCRAEEQVAGHGDE